MTIVIPDPTDPEGHAIISDGETVEVATSVRWIPNVAGDAPTVAELQAGVRVGWARPRDFRPDEPPT